MGAHTEGYNDDAHAICFVGNYESQHPTQKALEAAAKIHKRGVRNRHVRRDARILGHRDAGGAATACPGSRLYARLGTIRHLSR